MKTLILVFLSVSITFGEITPANASQSDNTNETVGAYNHLTLSFALVRNGLQIQSIRRDILGNVKLASLSPELQQLYRSLLQICDTALIQQEKVTQVESSLSKQKEQVEMQQNSEMISSLITSYTTGNPAALLALIFSDLPSDSEQMQTAVNTIQAMKTAIAQEVSDFEFQLSLEISELIQNKSALSKQLITTAQVDEYLDLESNRNRPDVYISSLELLFQRYPALYFVAYELGRNAFSNGRFTNAQQYFESTVKNTPSILNRNPIRVDAYCFIGDILVEGKEYKKALNQYSKALEEDEGSTHSLRGKFFALYHIRRYAEARRMCERYLRIKPDDANNRYNHACLLALTDAERNLVLEELKRAFNSGFTDIRHAKSDPDLASVRDTKQFRELLEMKFDYDVTWNIINADVILLTNRSEFDWTNVTVTVRYLENDSLGWKSIIEQPGVKKYRLRRYETLSINAFQSTMVFLKSVELNINTDQGSMRVLFQNNNGQLKVIDN